MTNVDRSLIIIISAPSGGGKTTIVDRLLERMPEIKRSVSYTTRQPRAGEKNNKDYTFIPEKEFRKKIDEDEFLEWEANFGNYYGTSKTQFEAALAEGADIILSIDVKGARVVKERYPESIGVFIMPPSNIELKSRLEKRNTNDQSDLEIRLEESKREIAAAYEYDHMIINVDLDKAVDELADIIVKQRKNREERK